MTVSFVAAGVLVLLDDGGVLPDNPSGLLERVALFAGLGWIGLVAGQAVGNSSVRRRARTPNAVQETTAAERGR